jgi:hypothetical protein
MVRAQDKVRLVQRARFAGVRRIEVVDTVLVVDAANINALVRPVAPAGVTGHGQHFLSPIYELPKLKIPY